jgi:cytoskeletal protein CcmA (bactofilin family)
MAQIIVTDTQVNLNVTTTQSNITVTDLESNITVNVSSAFSNIAVTNEPVNVTIAPSIGVSNAEIRAALSATSPIVYDNTTGAFTFDPSSYNMQLSSVTANSFITTAGNVTSSGLTVTNNASVGGLLNVNNISIAGDLNANLKDISLSYYDAGNVSGNVTLDVANGPVQKIRLTNNLTGLTFTGATSAQPITLIIQQDNVGFWQLNTTSFPSNWTNWLFTSNFKTLSTTANAYDLLSITFDGTNYYASLVNFVQTLITNAELANSNVIVNGTTINLGSSGNISHFGALTTTALPEGTNLYFTAARARGNVSAAAPLTYNSSTGQFGFADFAQIGGLNVNSTQAYAGVSLRVNKYTGGGNPNAMDVIGNATVSERLTVTGNVQGNFFIGNGSQLTGITSLTNAQVLSYIATQPLTVGGNLTVNGNINATGNINVQNVTDLYVRDQIIVLNANAATNANVQIISNRPTATSTSLRWNEQSTRWEFTNNGTTYFPMPTSTTDLVEGANLYYTTARANTAIGAYQGNINTPGTVTAGVANAITINTTDLNATNNVTVLGKLNAADGSNIQYVRAYSVDLVTNSGVDGLSVVLESSSNNRLAIADSSSFRYVPSTRTLLVSDGTIGSSAANTSFSGSNLFLSGNITAGNISVNRVTAGFLSGNGALITNINGANVFGLSTTQVSEGTNLYFTNTRVRSNVSATTASGITYDSGTGVFSLASIPNSSLTNSAITINGTAVSLGGTRTLTTSDIAEGTNLYFTAARARGNISAAENITYNSTTGVIGLANALGNVNSVTTATGTNLTLNSDNRLVVTERLKGVATNVGNISGDGYGFFLGAGLTGQTIVVNSSAGNLDAYYFTTGNATANSNVITGASIALIINAAPNVSANLNLVTPYYTVSPFGAAVQDPFPPGTYVTSVDAANSTVTLNNPAAVSRDLSVSFTGGGATFNRTALLPGAFDANTGLLAGLISQATAGAGASRSTLIGQSIFRQGAYGYPVTGPAPTDFVYAIGNSTNYTQGNLPTNRFAARTNFEAPRTVLAAPRGLVVGNGDLTSRAENDGLSSFGINVLWDGLTTNADYGGSNPFTQILLKQYSDNSFGGVNGGPRLFFTAARGNKNQSYLATYPRNNDEMGRITWWGPTQFLPGAGTVNPPAWISGVAGQDFVDTNSGMGMYFANSPNTTTFDRSLYLASTKGATLIASAQDSTAAQQPIIFAPSHLLPTGNNNGNSVFLYNQTVSGTETAIDDYAPSGAHFAQINYANVTGLTGAKVTVTNGNNFATVHEGNIALSIDRNSNSANVRAACRSGAANYNGSLNPDRVRFTFAPEGLVDGTAVTISGFTNATVAGALNGNVFYVKRNDTAGYIGYDLYTDSGLTTGVNLGVTNVNAGPGIFTYTRTNSVTAKEWSFVLPQGSNDLLLTEDGVTRTTFASGGNVNVTGNINLTGRLLGYDRVYGEFAYTAGNIVPAAADTIYAFPLDTTLVNSDVIANNTSRINITKPGFYKLFTSIQIKNADNSADHIMRFWLRKNGADVANSATVITPLKLQEQVVSMHWMVESDGDDYWEIVYYVNDTDVTFPYYESLTTPIATPAAPPIIVNVIPVGA